MKKPGTFSTNKKRMPLRFTALTICTLSLPLYAADPVSFPKFSTIDTNNDQKISEQEFRDYFGKNDRMAAEFYSSNHDTSPEQSTSTNDNKNANAVVSRAVTLTTDSKTVAELMGMSVYSNTGKKLGELEEIVKHEKTNNYKALISAGGILGIGEKLVLTDPEKLTIQEDRLILNSIKNVKEAKKLPEYNEQLFAEVQEGLLVKDVWLTQTISATSPATIKLNFTDSRRFQALDQNGNGKIEKAEANVDSIFVTKWRSADTNNDNVIDKTEFTAYMKTQ